MTVRFGVAASLLLLPSALAAGLYPSNSPVVQVDATNYKDLIGNSNHTSIVEFYVSLVRILGLTNQRLTSSVLGSLV